MWIETALTIFQRPGKICTVFWWENLQAKDNSKNLGISGSILLKLVLKKQDRRAWTGFIWLRLRTMRALVNTAKRRNSLTSSGHSDTRGLAVCHKGVLKMVLIHLVHQYCYWSFRGTVRKVSRATRCHNCQSPRLHTLCSS